MPEFFDRLIAGKKQGESLSAFSKRTGIPYNSLVAWRGGSTPRPETVISLAKVLGVDPAWLLFGKKSPQCQQ